MRILLDECLPRQLRQTLPGHQVLTVPQMGWAGTKNGALLRLAEGVFDVFITVDQNMRHQQDLRSMTLGIIVLVSQNNRAETLLPLISEVKSILGTLEPGAVTYVGSK